MSILFNNIILTGFMGTGKSSVGRKLAMKLGKVFLDTDDLIEKEAGLSIKEIFSRFGEARFRELEREVIVRVTSGALGEGIVLSTGGGAIVDSINRRALKRWGIVVCLRASVDSILKRVGNRDERPLLNAGDRRERIEGLLLEREEAYSDSDLIIDTTSKGIDEVVMEIRVYLERPGAKATPK